MNELIKIEVLTNLQSKLGYKNREFYTCEGRNVEELSNDLSELIANAIGTDRLLLEYVKAQLPKEEFVDIHMRVRNAFLKKVLLAQESLVKVKEQEKFFDDLVKD